MQRKNRNFPYDDDAKQLKKKPNENEMHGKLTDAVLKDDLRVIHFMRDSEIYKLERRYEKEYKYHRLKTSPSFSSRIGDLCKVYYLLDKREFDLVEFLSPNPERWTKKAGVRGGHKDQPNPFDFVNSTTEAVKLLLSRVEEELCRIERVKRPFSSHD